MLKLSLGQLILGWYLPKCTVYEAQVTISDKRVLCYGTSDGEFKTRFNNHTRSFRHKTGLHGTDELLHSHSPAYTILKIQLQYITCLKYAWFVYGSFIFYTFHYNFFYCLHQIFCLPTCNTFFFFLIVTLSFSCICYLLNTLKQS